MLIRTNLISFGLNPNKLAIPTKLSYISFVSHITSIVLFGSVGILYIVMSLLNSESECTKSLLDSFTDLLKTPAVAALDSNKSPYLFEAVPIKNSSSSGHESINTLLKFPMFNTNTSALSIIELCNELRL